VFERTVANEILGRLVKRGHVRVKFWDGVIRHYGDLASTAGPSLSVEITSPQVVRRLVANANLALGEGYMNGHVLVDEDQLPLLFELIVRNRPAVPLRQPFRRHRNHKAAQQSYVESHYNVGNDYYDLFLDRTRLYSCAYFRHVDDTLEQAQQQKINHLLRKLRLQLGMRI